MIEKIKHAAIKRTDGVVEIGISYEEIIKNSSILIPTYATVDCFVYTEGEEGFETSEGRFVDRHDAFDIAFASGQLASDTFIHGRERGISPVDFTWWTVGYAYTPELGYYKPTKRFGDGDIVGVNIVVLIVLAAIRKWFCMPPVDWLNACIHAGIFMFFAYCILFIFGGIAACGHVIGMACDSFRCKCKK